MTRLLALVWPELRSPNADASAFEPMLDALDDLSPRIEAVDAGVALVDVTGLGALHGTERRIAARAVMLARAVRPLHVRCGIGDNRWLAVLAARLARPERPEAPAALHVLPTGAVASRSALSDLSLALLPADAATQHRFTLFGLTRMGQLAELPRSAVGAQFGVVGERLQALARGEDPRPIVPRRRPERLTSRVAFEPPLDGIGAIALALRRACAELCDRLSARHLAPGRAILALALEDAPWLRVAQPFPEPALEPDWIARLLLSRLEAAARTRTRAFLPNSNPIPGTQDRVVPERAGDQGKLGKSKHLGMGDGARGAQVSRNRNQVAVQWEPLVDSDEPRVVGIELTLDRLTNPTGRQLPAFEARAGRWEELRWSLERMRHRFGEGRLWRAAVDRPTAALDEQRSRLVDIGA